MSISFLSLGFLLISSSRWFRVGSMKSNVSAYSLYSSSSCNFTFINCSIISFVVLAFLLSVNFMFTFFCVSGLKLLRIISLVAVSVSSFSVMMPSARLDMRL